MTDKERVILDQYEFMYHCLKKNPLIARNSDKVDYLIYRMESKRRNVIYK